MSNYSPDETWHRLRDWTYGQPPSERHISGGEAVWLIQPPRELKISDSWKPREGVIVAAYLGMYTLVAELDEHSKSAAQR